MRVRRWYTEVNHLGKGFVGCWFSVVGKNASTENPEPTTEKALRFRIQQLGKARIVGNAVEVGVGAGLDAVLRIQPDRLGQVFDALLGFARHAGQQREAVE